MEINGRELARIVWITCGYDIDIVDMVLTGIKTAAREGTSSRPVKLRTHGVKKVISS